MMYKSDWLKVSDDALSKLHTRQLLKVYRQSRGWQNTCGCPYHCGDEYLSQMEIEENAELANFRDRLRAVLNTREHVPSSVESRFKRKQEVRKIRPKEKKVMKY